MAPRWRSTEYITIRLYNVRFLVDLLNTGTLKEGSVHVRVPSGEMSLVGPDWKPPRQEPEIIGDKQVHYRVVIK
jgi:hypothetical protein